MSDTSSQESLHLEVTNFGPIVKAEIDLRPLTVFVGPSNTGKSYLAILIYALHRIFGARKMREVSFLHSTMMSMNNGTRKPIKKTVDSLIELAEQISSSKRKKSQMGNIVIPGPVMDQIFLACDNQGSDLENEIMWCFGEDEAGNFVRHGIRTDVRIIIQKGSSNNRIFQQEMVIGSKKSTHKKRTKNEMPIQINADDLSKPKLMLLHRMARILKHGGTEPDMVDYFFRETMESLAMPYLVGPLHCPAFYLPADRHGAMHAHGALVREALESIPMAGIRRSQEIPIFSGVLAAFLSQLVEFGNARHQRRQGEYRGGLATKVEESILGGSVRVNVAEVTRYPRFTYQPKGWKDYDLPLANASSMVTELAPVVLYLRYAVEGGSVLIVEEPESHLHPSMQVAFIRQLAKLVDSGVRVIVTTHSEWVIEELANIIQRSELPDVNQKKNAGDDDGNKDNFALDPEQVGVWLFESKLRPKGSMVKEICLGESGLFPSGFDDVAMALHNDWADISSRTQKSK